MSASENNDPQKPFIRPATFGMRGEPLRLPLWMKRVFRMALWGVVVLYFVFMALILVLRHVVLPNIDNYRDDIVRAASQAIEQRVSITDIDAAWSGLRPQLILKQVVVYDRNQRPALSLPRVTATVSWESLIRFEVHLHSLVIEQANLDIRRDANQLITVAGIPVTFDNSKSTMREWVLAQDEIIIRNSQVRWNDEWRKAPELSLTNIQFILQKTRLRHDFALKAMTPVALVSGEQATPLDLRGHFSSSLFSRTWSDTQNWKGEVYTQFSDIDLGAWYPWIDFPIELKRGNGALRAWLSFGAEQVVEGHTARQLELTADVHLKDVTTRLLKDLPILGLDHVDGRIAYRLLSNPEMSNPALNDSELTLKQFSLKESNGLELAPTDLTAQYTAPRRNKSAQGKLTTTQMDLETLASIAGRLPFSVAVRKLLTDHQPKGLVRNLTFQWQGPINAMQRYDVASNFENLSVQAQTAPSGVGQPGFSNLSGSIKATQTGGSIKLASQNAVLSFPGVFAEPDIRLAKLEAQAAWTLDAKAFDIQVNSFALENADLAGSGQAKYHSGLGAGDSGTLDLSGRLTRAEASQVARYLPLDMPESTRLFLKYGLLSGRAEDVDFKVSGPVDLIPYGPTSVQKAKAREKAALTASKNVAGSSANTNIASITNIGATVTSAGDSARNVVNKLAQVTPLGKLVGVNPAASTTSGNVFHISGNLRKVALNYVPHLPGEAGFGDPKAAPLWPVFEDINGTLLIDQSRLVIEADSAQVYGVKLEKVKAEITDVEDHDLVLMVTGGAVGPLQDLVRFTNASPVSKMIEHFTATTRATGTARLNLKLNLPLADIERSKVVGSITFQNNDITLLSGMPPLQRVNGRLDFSEKGMGIQGVTGQFVGGSMKLDGSTRADGMIELRGDGTINLTNALSNRSNLGDESLIQNLAEHLTGSTRYTVAVNVNTHSNPSSATTPTPVPPLLIVESSLAGLGINLPDPIRKAATDSWPLRVDLVNLPAVTRNASTPSAPASASDQIRFRLGTVLNATFERRPDRNGEMQITRAAYGINEPAALNETSTYVNINAKSLDLDAWGATLKQLTSSKPTSAPSGPAAPATSPTNVTQSIKLAEDISTSAYLPEVFALRTTDLRLGGKNFANISAAASRIQIPGSNELTWQANIDAEQVSGYITWRQGQRQDLVTARLARLKIPQSDVAESNLNSVIDSDAQEMPALDIVADSFELSGKKWGKLELQATNTIANASNFNRREWQLQKLNITNDDAKFEAKGVWGPELSLSPSSGAGTTAPANGSARQRTQLSFTINANNVGKLMDRFGLKNTVRNGTASLEGAVMWRGSPLKIDYGSLDGQMHLEAEKGQFLQADPGIAKLLGVLSLQSLPRRLTLDFRDVFSEGFAFDTIRSNVTVDNGVASTKDFKMRGVQATVLIEGSTDLARETQNLHVLVLPEINAGAASLGYAALANPAIGLATFLAQYVLRDPLTRAFSYEYNVTGSWADPTMTKVDRQAEPKLVLPPASPSNSKTAAPASK